MRAFFSRCPVSFAKCKSTKGLIREAECLKTQRDSLLDAAFKSSAPMLRGAALLPELKRSCALRVVIGADHNSQGVVRRDKYDKIKMRVFMGLQGKGRS